MENEALIRLTVFAGLFALFAGLEAFAPRRDRTQTRKARWTTNWAIIIIDTVTLRAMAMYFQATTMKRIGNDLVARYQKRVFAKLMSSGVDFFNDNRSGRLAALSTPTATMGTSWVSSYAPSSPVESPTTTVGNGPTSCLSVTIRVRIIWSHRFR